VTCPDAPSPEPSEPPVRAGLPLPIDIVIAPGRAFLKIARTNEWLPAVGVIVALGIATMVLAMPAIVHFASAGAHGSPPPGANDVRIQVWFVGSELVLVPLVIAGLTATTLTLTARFKDAQAPWVRYFALAANCLVLSALGNFVHVVAVVLRAPASYQSPRAFELALPDNLGIFAAPGNDRELDFLSRFGIFDLWAFVLIAIGFSAFANVRFTTALILAVVLDFTYAVFFNN
jgi:hypothetical protein